MRARSHALPAAAGSHGGQRTRAEQAALHYMRHLLPPIPEAPEGARFVRCVFEPPAAGTQDSSKHVRRSATPWAFCNDENVLGGDLAEPKLASHPGIGEDDVEGSALGLHRRVESVEVGLIRDRALHRAGIGPEVDHSGVERWS